jgi:hypothetical protein
MCSEVKMLNNRDKRKGSPKDQPSITGGAF